MARDPYACVSPEPSAWETKAARWFPTQTTAGVHQVLNAVRKKNLALLHEALVDHPDVLAARYHRLDKKCQTLGRGYLSHVMVNLNWSAALDVLWEAGDRFKQRIAPDALTSVETAIFEGNTGALNRMLKLGVPADQDFNPPAAVLLLGAWQRTSDGAVVAKLAKAGASPWSWIGPQACCLLQELLANNRNAAAMELLHACPSPPDKVDRADLTNAWVKGYNTFLHGAILHSNPAIYERMLDRLMELGCPPPPLDQVAAAGLDLHAFQSKEHGTHAAVMSRLVRHRAYTPADVALALAVSETVDYEGCAAWKASLEARALATHAPAVSARRASPRL